MRSRADIREIERFRLEELLPGRTIYECIQSAASLNPEKAAITFLQSADLADPPRVITYAALMAAIHRTANLFREISGASRTAVAVILPMIPEGLMATWGAATAGICVPINPHLEMEGAISVMNASAATVMVTTPDKFEAGTWVTPEDVMARVPTLRRILFVDPDYPTRDLMTLAEARPADRLTFEPPCDPAAEAMYMPTGGTTGTPKVVKMTHGGQVKVAWNVGALMGSAFDGVVGHGMPNFHCGGSISLGLRTIMYGQTLLTLTSEGFRNQGVIRHFWDIARKYRMTSLLATPTTAAAILSAADGISDGHCITDFHCGGSTVPLELVRRFHDRFGIWLRENWGMTELHGTTTGHPNDGKEPRVGSVGCSLPSYRTRAIKVDDSNTYVADCAPGERGVLVIEGPTLMLGYTDEGLDDAFFVKGTPDGIPWANTGDLGAVDEDGYVWVFGRAKDLIIRGGHNIDPKNIEDVLIAHPAVLYAAAIGRPDPSKGELPMAYVQLKAGMENDAPDLIAFCKERIPERAAVPAEIVVIDAMPLTAVGKISKPALRMDAMQRTVSQVVRDVVGQGVPYEITIDQTGRRPSALLKIDIPPAQERAVKSSVAAALTGFEFATRIEVPSESAPRG
jgi:fatty-acyl-CoA synthase